jgi:hypothetical protein
MVAGIGFSLSEIACPKSIKDGLQIDDSAGAKACRRFASRADARSLRYDSAFTKEQRLTWLA